MTSRRSDNFDALITFQGQESRMQATTKMMIIAGGEPELCRRRHAKREGGVYAPPYALRVRKSCPECSVHVLCL